MSSANLKAEKRVTLIRYNPVLDFEKLKDRLKILTSEKQSNKLAYDLMELDCACEYLRREVQRLYTALWAPQRDSTPLWDASTNLAGQLMHLRYHIRSALPVVEKLADLARTMPPLDKATDLQLTERTLEASYLHMESLGVNLRGDKRASSKKSAKDTHKKPTTRRGKSKKRRASRPPTTKAK